MKEKTDKERMEKKDKGKEVLNGKEIEVYVREG